MKNFEYQSLKVKGTVPKTVAKNGTYKIMQCKNIDKAIANNNQILAKIPT